MTGRPLVPPPAWPRSDLPVVEAAWLASWRAFWNDCPLAWAGEIDRFLFRWAPPVGAGAAGDRRSGLD